MLTKRNLGCFPQCGGIASPMTLIFSRLTVVERSFYKLKLIKDEHQPTISLSDYAQCGMGHHASD